MPTALDVEATALERLVAESLRKERLRSDPDGTEVAELDWMHEQDEGVPMSPETRKRWYLAQGIDLVDDDYDDWINASLPRGVTKSTALLL